MKEWFLLSLFHSGSQTQLVQLAVVLSLPPFVAGGAQESERPLRYRRPLLLRLHQNLTPLQCLPVPGDGGIPGATTSAVSSCSGCGETLLLRPGAPHWSGKLTALDILHQPFDRELQKNTHTHTKTFKKAQISYKDNTLRNGQKS